jgi:hypothetical protein
MKIYNTLYFLFLFFYLNACSTSITDDSFNSKQLVSSKGEKIYINSINRGVTGDCQLSIISKNPHSLKEIDDTVGVVEGLDPFIYSFNNDTLTLFFYDSVHYKIKEKFKTIMVNYIVVSDSTYLLISEKALYNFGYFSVPAKNMTK